MEDYGLPTPRAARRHPSAGQFLTRASCGDVAFKPNIKTLEGGHVRFEDDSVEPVAIVYATCGYRISFPFFADPAFQPGADNRFPLFKRMMIPGVDDLFFMGLAQALPTLVNFAEQQSSWSPPMSPAPMRCRPPRKCGGSSPRTRPPRSTAITNSTRHTIQVDFTRYVADLQREIARGERRARKAA
ncbi:hypothetical protein AB5I41_12720 [Sphingomonas sp. MMS24-JH45]